MLFLLLCLLPCLPLGGCGYSLAGGQPTVLGSNNATLKMKGVEQPTLYPWLGQIIRSDLRDELGARRAAVWVDDGPSDYSIQINVQSFTIRSYLQTSQDNTLLYNATIKMQAVIYSGKDNSVVWRSSMINYSNQVETFSERAAAEQLSLQAVRLLVAEMRNTF